MIELCEKAVTCLFSTISQQLEASPSWYLTPIYHIRTHCISTSIISRSSNPFGLLGLLEIPLFLPNPIAAKPAAILSPAACAAVLRFPLLLLLPNPGLGLGVGSLTLPTVLTSSAPSTPI